jgi:hypothetical protein
VEKGELSSTYKLDLMRALQFFALLLIVILAGCATPPPKIEGRINSVSPADIREVIALTQSDMKKVLHRALPIKRVDVIDRNHINLVFRYDGNDWTTPAKRTHGIWSITTEWVEIGG